MLEMAKPLKRLLLFLVINYKEMLSKQYEERMNLITLNSLEVNELIAQLSKDMDKSRRFYY
jgi:hypothetical protein